ncbi:carboxymuconolactone decarboxylase family protein [Altericroceibacterium endophyticum]|uniref:Carboxymuconolactone decarboxylase family protein n=1 Tax=Altericroceibacterium endophyticum TaxID=1808508 RepID=A0A6I4TB12_9SPHN|nr:carboxymuconolactone decarboxylase family protein [Altericroceibacterium endophyticum]MXO67183.1 carboxymuconolactone decarboxylase family protein [Altericroceibacterium endophyticum]
MTQRLDYFDTAPDTMKPMVALEESLARMSISTAMRELLKIRASQINGCAYCLNMHLPAARKAGIPQRKLDVLAAWRESPAFTVQERAALGWCEALTRIETTGADDSSFTAFADAFSPVEQVEITLIITTINAWNRIAVGFRSQHPLEAQDAA